tara:strand:- start:747 stop:851 length:105 start_codon:yes stop_codon:yes gene_type:complete
MANETVSKNTDIKYDINIELDNILNLNTNIEEWG